jgi:glucose 1-dehydrogenase
MEKEMVDLTGKVAVITGGTRGLGYAIALELANSGAKVVVGSRNGKSLQMAVQSLQNQGYSVAGLAGDVSDLNYIKQLAEKAQETFGHMDIWINNAGMAGAYGPTLEIPVSEYKNVLATNITGVYQGSLVAMEVFTRQGSGKLINILGRGWNGPVPYQNAYAPTKAWGKNFTLGLAKENENKRINIFAFNPGMVLTDLLTRVHVVAGYEDKLKAFPMVIRLLAKPAEIPARKVAWLASSATDNMTGKVIQIPFVGQVIFVFLQVLSAKIFNQKLPPMDIHIESVPGAQSSNK